VQAIKDAKPPTCVKELQHLLALTKFLHSKASIPNRSIVSSMQAPHAAWNGGKEHQRALSIVKLMPSSDRVLVHYSSHAPLVIAADASSCGVGAVLSHILKEGNQSVERPIMFASRTLSKAERSYSQLDREALAT